MPTDWLLIGIWQSLVQVVGHKTVWLSPPQTSLFMKSCCLPKDSRTSDASVVSEDMISPNTSRLDVFSAENIVDDVPDFAEKVLPLAMSVELGPGDLLFFPPGWWHGMRSESTSFSVSMWFWSFLVVILDWIWRFLVILKIEFWWSLTKSIVFIASFSLTTILYGNAYKRISKYIVYFYFRSSKQPTLYMLLNGYWNWYV